MRPSTKPARRRRRIGVAAGALILSGTILTALAPPANAAQPVMAAEPASAAPDQGGTLNPAAVAQAEQIIRANSAAIRASGADHYTAQRSIVDANGAAHVRYTRTYNGLRVRGGDFVVHAAPGGAFAGTSIGMIHPLNLSTLPRLSPATASATARARFSGTVASVGAPELIIDATSGTGRLAWETTVTGQAADGITPSRLHVITDAATGTFVHSYDEIETVYGGGTSLYSGTVGIDTTYANFVYNLWDPSHGGNSTCDMNNGNSVFGPCPGFTDADNIWGNGTTSDRRSAAVDAYYGAAVTYDYFKNVHGRNGIFGDGAGVPSRVHFGNNYANAFWDGTQMTYGDGAGNARPVVSLDVAGHEMSHGITAALVPGGMDFDEAGAINEATSDIFGTMVEFYAANFSDSGDYTIGEKININGDGTPLRYMDHPSLDGHSDNCWNSGTPYKDPHFASGVANHFFYILAQSSTSPDGSSAICVPQGVNGIGDAAAERIWFRALDVYFTSTTSYRNPTNPSDTVRAYTLRATADLYGTCSTEYKVVQRAWTAVSVTGNDPVCAPKLTRVSSHLSLPSCQVYGQWGWNAGYWITWWCSQVIWNDPYGYELWAYVN